MAYFKRINKDFNLPESKEDFADNEKLLEAFKHSCIMNTQAAGTKMMEHIGNGVDPKAVFDYMVGSRLWEMGKLHGIVSIAANAMDRMATIKDRVLKEVMDKVLNLFLIDQIEVFSQSLGRSKSIKLSTFAHIQERKEELLEAIDPHALVLAEGARVPDNILMSAIGHSNAKPYENLYKWAKEFGALNQHPDKIHPGIRKYYHPYRDEKLREMGKQKL